MPTERAMFGPWRPDLEPAERITRFRAMAALAAVFTGGHPIVRELLDAEQDPGAADRSLAMLEAYPLWCAVACSRPMRRSIGR